MLLFFHCLARSAASRTLRADDGRQLEPAARALPPCTSLARTSSGATRSRACSTAVSYRLLVAAISVGIGLVGGAVIGMIAGYRAGLLDSILMRAMDLLFSFPAILLAIVIMAVLGSSVTNAMIAIGIIFIPGFARYARSLTRSVVLEQFVAYGRSTGVPFTRILLRDVLPNVAPGLIVQATVAVGYAVTLEATLSFLGLGAQPPAPSWGNMIDAGRGFMSRAPLMVVAPALAILFTVLVIESSRRGPATKKR